MYRIKDWDRYFESHKTRILKRLDWLAIPNKMDGDGYTELVDHPDGAAHYGVWVALLLVASKSEPRGTLARSGGVPHDIGSISRVTRLPIGSITPALRRLVSIGWLEEIQANQINSMALSGVDPAISGGDPAETGRYIEGNRTEGKGREVGEEERASPKTGSATSRGSRFDLVEIPLDWQAWATKEFRWDLEKCDQVFAIFGDYWRGIAGAKGLKADWLGTWRNWCRREESTLARLQPPRGGTYPNRESATDRVMNVVKNRLLAGERPF